MFKAIYWFLRKKFPCRFGDHEFELPRRFPSARYFFCYCRNCGKESIEKADWRQWTLEKAEKYEKL